MGVQVDGLPLDLDREYSLATREYMVRGGGTIIEMRLSLCQSAN